ncbi:MAG: hypothetical protein F2663_06735 [Actinobacteria bacterium]|uniref:Unannotated protein n=1 Tax=freshwater metagenome TaxID=449393 RepID=A0A6J6PRC3_9ZZZZ|nr:hypothetical protein [Actinomycetota bacterium]
MDIDLARQQWDDGLRRVESTRANRTRYWLLHGQVDAVTSALRQRLGATYTLHELAEEYGAADRWARDVVDSIDPEAPPAADVGTVTDAAFHLYARGAQDYHP